MIKLKPIHLLSIVFSIVILQSCATLQIENGTPQCLETKIRTFNTSNPCSDAMAKEYTFQGTVVYVLEPGTCGADMMAEVIKSDCSSLGFLGGIAGNTTINGENFANATFVRIVWQK